MGHRGRRWRDSRRHSYRVRGGALLLVAGWFASALGHDFLVWPIDRYVISPAWRHVIETIARLLT